MHYSVAVFSKTAEQAEQFMKKYVHVDSYDFEHFDPEICEWEVADEAMIKEAEESVAREKSDEYTFEIFAREMEQYRKSWDVEEDFDEFVRNQFKACKSDENNVDLYMKDVFCKCWCEQIHAYAEMHNPNDKYDGYVFGGRFANSLRLKAGCKGEYAPESNYGVPPREEGLYARARLADVSLEADEELARRAKRYWEIKMEGADSRADEDFLHYEFLDLKDFTSKEEYVNYRSRVCSAEYIDPDGNIHMGVNRSFAVRDTDGTYRLRDEMLNWLHENPDLLVSIYDIHI